MDHVLKQKQNKNNRLFVICQRLLSCIRAKIRMAMSCCKIRYINYTFRTLNVHGCPMLSKKRNMKIKKYVTKKLQEERFQVRDIPQQENGVEWQILVSW